MTEKMGGTAVRAGLLTTTATSLILGAGVLGASVPAAAQQAEPAWTASGGLEEIVVTARKREESVQDVPVLITALSSEQVNRYDLTSLEKLAAYTPQFNVGRAASGSGAQITLRGIGSQATSIGLEQSTAVIVDGVYYGQGRVINEAMFDLQRIELLKGPQALFFGKNATAGVVAISTADPTDKFEAMARVGYEFRSENVIGEGVVSGPITSDLTGRFAVRMSNMFGGYFKNRAEGVTTSTFDIATNTVTPRFQAVHDGDQPGTNEKVGRATFKWTPTDRLTMKFKASALRTSDESNAWNYVPFACPSGFTQPNPDVPCKRNFNVYIVKAPDGIAGNIPDSKEDGAPYNLYKSIGLTGDIRYELPNVAITSVTNYNWNRNKWGLAQNVQSATSFIAATENTSYWAFSNETRVETSLDGPVNLMIGAYYQNSKRDYQQHSAFTMLEDSSQPLDRRYATYFKDSQTDGETISAFGQARWRIVPELELAGGVRYIHETKDSFLVQPYIVAPLQGLFLQDVTVAADQTFNNWSPEATLTYQPTEDMTIYGAFKTAYKAGGFSNSAFVTALTLAEDIAFEPEKAHGFEIGVKTTLLDRQLRFNVGAYTYKYENLQVDYFDSITFEFVTTNAGAARTKGVEIELQYAPHAVPGLTIQGSLNYNKARYLEYIAPCYGGQTIAAGCNTTFRGGFGQDLSGFPTAIAPDWTATLGGNYETAVAENFILGLSANARYSDSYLGSSFGMPLSRQGSYVNLDAAVRLGTADGRWEFAVIGRNLTNHFSISGVLDLPNSGIGTGMPTGTAADQIGLANLPRTVQAQLTWRY